MTPGVPLPPEVRARVVALTCAGVSASRIAADVGCSARTVHRIRAAEGVAGSPPSPVGADVLAFMGRLLDDGASFAEVARSVGVDVSTVRRHFPDRLAWTTADRTAYLHLRRERRAVGLVAS